jgi:CBS domain-containing protein
MNEVERFLSAHPPFGSLTREQLATVASSISVAFFPAGDDVLREGGAPAEALFVIRRGAVALLHGDDVVDVLEEGEPFGHPSLLTGDAPMHTARVSEDALCYLIPREVADDVFGTASGVGFLVRSLRERARARARIESTVVDPRLVRVGSIATRSAPVCEVSTTVREAAQRMTETGATAVLVVDGGVHGIVTDSDLRARIVASGGSLDSPLADVMTAPVRAIAAERLAHEALLEMLDGGVHHLPVVDGDRLVGLVSDLDLLGLERRDPFVLRSEIERSADIGSVIEVGRRLTGAAVTLAHASVTAEDLGHVIASILDAMTTRLLDLAIEELGEPPAQWAWFALGSQARRERGIAGDQDHLLVLADSGGTEGDRYFSSLASRVVDGLELAGVPRCPSDVMATDAAWRRTRAGWRAAFRSWIDEPASQAAFATAIAFDHRKVAGPLDVEDEWASIVRDAGRHAGFVHRSARLALEQRPPLGIRGTVRTTRDGDGGHVDVKGGGLLPIVDLARALAIRARSTDVGTFDRLRAAGTARLLDEDDIEALIAAFGLLLELRLEHHVRRADAGLVVDDLVDPSELDPIARGGLRDAFRAIAHVQDRVGRDMSRSRLR